MTTYIITVKESEAEDLKKALDFLDLKYTTGFSHQCFLFFMFKKEIVYLKEFTITHGLKSRRELKAVLRHAGAKFGQEKKKYVSLSKEALALFKPEPSPYMSFSGFDRYADDGRCVRCEGWGCDTFQMTGGY